MVKKCKWQKALELMEELEITLNWIFGKGNRPQYEEDMDLDYWNMKRRLKEKILLEKRGVS